MSWFLEASVPTLVAEEPASRDAARTSATHEPAPCRNANSRLSASRSPEVDPAVSRSTTARTAAGAHHGVPPRACDGLLPHGHGRRNGLDSVGVGFLEPFEKPARIRGKTFDVPPLSLGIQGVESQTALPRAAHSGDDDQPAQRNVKIDI